MCQYIPQNWGSVPSSVLRTSEDIVPQFLRMMTALTYTSFPELQHSLKSCSNFLVFYDLTNLKPHNPINIKDHYLNNYVLVVNIHYYSVQFWLFCIFYSSATSLAH